MSLGVITIVLPNLSGGGAERLHVNLANDWVLMGYKVRFILLLKQGELISLLATEIEIIDLKVYRIRDAILPLASHFRRMRSNVTLVAMWPLTSAAVFAWVLSGCTGKLYLSEHENLSESYIGQGRARAFYLYGLIKISYPIATGVIAVSRGVKLDLCSLGSLSDNFVRVIYNPAAIGTMPALATASTRGDLWGDGVDYRILAVGRLSPQKDHQTLIRAVALLPKHIAFRLVILGEGPLRRDLEELVNRLGLNGRVALPGFVVDPRPWFLSASLFVLSSKWEGFGNVIVEALECGLPVVSTDCPSGPSEILEDGRFGKLVPVHDPAALSKAITESLQEPHDHAALMLRALDFSVRKISEEYLSYMF
jgi:glycosyltransferase involved in cell wall biosynthesis